jgi:hypothetical protein
MHRWTTDGMHSLLRMSPDRKRDLALCIISHKWAGQSLTLVKCSQCSRSVRNQLHRVF